MGLRHGWKLLRPTNASKLLYSMLGVLTGCDIYLHILYMHGVLCSSKAGSHSTMQSWFDLAEGSSVSNASSIPGQAVTHGAGTPGLLLLSGYQGQKCCADARRQYGLSCAHAA